MCNNKDDVQLTDTKSTKLDAERSKREDAIIFKRYPPLNSDNSEESHRLYAEAMDHFRL